MTGCSAYAGEEWERAHDDGSISVDVRTEDGHSIRSFRATTVLPGSIDSVMAVLADPDGCSQWIHGCERAEILDSAGFFQRNTYQVNDFPWPTKDRDLVLEVKINQMVDEGIVRYDMINRPGYRAPTDLVRIEEFKGVYLLKEIGKDKTQIEWTQHANPGGSVPGWLVNAMVLDVPVKTLEGLSKMVTETPYVSATIERDSQGVMLGWAQTTE